MAYFAHPLFPLAHPVTLRLEACDAAVLTPPAAAAECSTTRYIPEIGPGCIGQLPGAPDSIGQSPPTDVSHDSHPLGPLLPDWHSPPPPPYTLLQGHGCRLEPVDAARHAQPLFDAFAEDTAHALWTYLPYGPFTDAKALAAWLDSKRGLGDQQLYTIIDAASGAALGLCGYLRIQPEAGSIEVGNLTYSPRLQRSRLATAAMVLMMENVFALGYRRYEWKCNALNAPSRRAAERLGFTFEGIFRQATVVKGHNRDTAWYSVLDHEWPRLRDTYARWLAPDNFDEDGRQRHALSAWIRSAMTAARAGHPPSPSNLT